MSFYRPIILSTIILLYSFCSGAQDNNYVYKDTAFLYADSVESLLTEAEPVEDADDDGDAEFIADTILRNNELFIRPDSIKVLKNLKPFAYARNLDSLLYAYQQSLEGDNVNSKDGISLVDRFFLSPITKYFFWMLAVLFLSFILYKLFFAEGLFLRPYAKNNVVPLPGEEENLSKNTDYGKLIAQAIAGRNYRMAVRYHYLQSLQKLSLKGVIQFAADKTNLEYLRELSGKTYKNAFASLTLNYEYVWYGEFEIDVSIFNAIQSKFKQFNSEV